MEETVDALTRKLFWRIGVPIGVTDFLLASPGAGKSNAWQGR
jgi:hypothetical protein